MMIRAKCHGCGENKYCSSSYGEYYCRACWKSRRYAAPIAKRMYAAVNQEDRK
jgi:hypothetical protein